MGLFGDLGRIAREVKTISDQYAGIKNEAVASVKDLAQQALDTERVVKDGVKSTIEQGKSHVASKVTDAKEEVKKNVQL